MAISRTDLTTTVQPYNGAYIGGQIVIQGFVDVKHGENLIAHYDFNKFTAEQARAEGLTESDIQTRSDNEAAAFLASDDCNNKIEDYIYAYNLGLYGAQ